MIQNFYILAMGRSGTTLLQSILDNHSGIVVPPESYFMIHLDKKYGSIKNWNKQIISRFINDLYTDRPFRLTWRIPKKDIVEAFELATPVKSFESACNVIRSTYKKSYLKKKLVCIGDKKPLYAAFTDRLMKTSPKAKIIHMVRDPRGVGNGQINTFKKKDALALGYIWNKQNKSILKLREKFPNQYFLLKYEDLIKEPEKTIKLICEFLNVTYNSDVMNYLTNTSTRFDQYTQVFKDRHKSLLQPIKTSISEKWKTDLDSKSKKHIEYITYDLANFFGYHFQKPKTDLKILIKSPFSKLKVLIGMLVLKLFFGMPFVLRKLILQIRSKFSDHKYWPEQHMF